MKLKPRILFTIFLVMLFAFMVFKAMDFPFAGRLFPLVVGIPALILSIVQMVLDLIASPKADSQDVVDIAPDKSIPARIVRARAIRFLCWFLGLYLGIWVLGFKIALPLFFIIYMRVEARARWLVVVSLTAISVYAVFYHFEELLGVFWPQCLLSMWLKIPWLF
jgi:hypothetical protein